MIAEFPNKFNVSPGFDIGKMLITPESLSGILNILVIQAIQYYKYGLGESLSMMKVKEEYLSGLTRIIKSILESDYISEQNSHVLAVDLEDRINQALSPNRLKQGQLKEVMNTLGYESVKFKSRGDDRDKMVYLGLKHR